MKINVLSMLCLAVLMGGLMPAAMAGGGERATHTAWVDNATATW